MACKASDLVNRLWLRSVMAAVIAGALMMVLPVSSPYKLNS
ncbi:MAG: hypothetical protein NTV49_02325 [Kiritimatiellaeota bacterium]|nr:hypothetical protein [Kiritimatiellota bacterium]